jgi:2-phospho-L-lactate guanylyltransferase (CobY/MobA/RfbA family)
MLADYKGALKDSNEVNVLQPHHFANARAREMAVGRLPRSLKDLNKVDLLQLNDVIILQRQGVVKILLKDYLGALNNLNKGDVLKPKDALSLQMQDYALRSSIQGLPEIQPCSRLE